MYAASRRPHLAGMGAAHNPRQEPRRLDGLFAGELVDFRRSCGINSRRTTGLSSNFTASIRFPRYGASARAPATTRSAQFAGMSLSNMPVLEYFGATAPTASLRSSRHTSVLFLPLCTQHKMTYRLEDIMRRSINRAFWQRQPRDRPAQRHNVERSSFPPACSFLGARCPRRYDHRPTRDQLGNG
jgi:hypothetical protein